MVKVFSLFDYYKLIQRKNILISYKGPITPVIMAEISTDIRAKLIDDPKASRKMFAIFMELAQNTLYYSAEKVNFANRNDSVGILLLTESEDGYAFYCGNVVENGRVNDLVESCNMINSLDREELRRFKREQRNGPQKEFSKGAGIGLIHVALTSESPLQIESQQVDDEYAFFAISVNIKNNKIKMNSMETAQLENLKIEGEKGTFFIPHVDFNAQTGVCKLEGESYLEDTWEFYGKLQQWLAAYTATGKPLKFEFRLTYFNTSSSKGILDLMKTLKAYEDNAGQVSVTWYYPEEDEDNLEEAEDFKEDTGLAINFVGY